MPTPIIDFLPIDLDFPEPGMDPRKCSECAGSGRVDRAVMVDNSGRPDYIRESCDACEGAGTASPFKSLTWAQMDRAQRQKTLQNMSERGGSFVKRLSLAWLMADEINAGKLARAFPELVSNYAPKE